MDHHPDYTKYKTKYLSLKAKIFSLGIEDPPGSEDYKIKYLRLKAKIFNLGINDPPGSEDPKMKYLKLKKYLNGGNGVDNFFTRAKGTKIEFEYDILFNLALVNNALRPAYLLEVANYPTIAPTELLKIIKNIYDEFMYTIEYEIDNEPHRVFIHINPLTKKQVITINGLPKI